MSSSLSFLQKEAKRREAQTEANWDTLLDYVLMAASRDEKHKLVGYAPREVGPGAAAAADLLIVETRAEARIGTLLAEAFLLWSADIHEPDDRATLDGVLTRAEAVVLVSRHDGVRPAARATGLSKDVLFRALKREDLSSRGSPSEVV